MAARVSHINEQIARKIDRGRKNPLMFRALSVGAIAAIFKGAGTPRTLLGVEIVEEICPLTGDVVIPGRTVLASCADIAFNGADFASGQVRPVWSKPRDAYQLMHELCQQIGLAN
jgi:hypothetical protein